MKNRRLLTLLVGIVVLSAAFLLLNFHAAVSNTQSEKNITTTSIGDGIPDAMRLYKKINIALIADNSLVRPLRKAMAVEMQNSGMDDFELVQGLEPAYQSPVLVIKVGKPSLLWTPFYAASQLSIQAGYASSGDTSFMGETPIALDNKNGPALYMHAEFQVSDHSWGLLSRLGYQQILADYLARIIVSSLNDLYQSP